MAKWKELEGERDGPTLGQEVGIHRLVCARRWWQVAQSHLQEAVIAVPRTGIEHSVWSAGGTWRWWRRRRSCCCAGWCHLLRNTRFTSWAGTGMSIVRARSAWLMGTVKGTLYFNRTFDSSWNYFWSILVSLKIWDLRGRNVCFIIFENFESKLQRLLTTNKNVL